ERRRLALRAATRAAVTTRARGGRPRTVRARDRGAPPRPHDGARRLSRARRAPPGDALPRDPPRPPPPTAPLPRRALQRRPRDERGRRTHDPGRAGRPGLRRGVRHAARLPVRRCGPARDARDRGRGRARTDRSGADRRSARPDRNLASPAHHAARRPGAPLARARAPRTPPPRGRIAPARPAIFLRKCNYTSLFD